MDGALPSWRQAISLIASQSNLPVPTRSISRAAALNVGTAFDLLRALHLPGIPPALNRFTARVAGARCVYRIDRAQKMLGYRPTLDFLKDGLPFIHECRDRPV